MNSYIRGKEFGRTLMKQICALLAACVAVTLAIPTNVAAQQSPSHDGYIVGDASSFWTKTTIPVCWENPDPYDARELNIVKNAVNTTWAAHSKLNFTGWEKCAPNSKGIRVYVDPFAHPHVKTFGRFLDGVKNGVVLNFDFKGEYKCFRAIDDCNRIIAVHEFGHAIGFHHEQNRSDTDQNGWCYQKHYQGKVPNQKLVTVWDINSVMNYCNPKWAADGKLSPLDIKGVSSVYGSYQSETQDWSGVWTSETYNKLVDRRFGYKLNFRQTGDQVIGIYSSNDGNSIYGNIEGTLKGNVLEGTWARTDPGAPKSARGGIILSLDKDSSSFSGHYSQGSWAGYK